jgi:hypothetical protein
MLLGVAYLTKPRLAYRPIAHAYQGLWGDRGYEGKLWVVESSFLLRMAYSSREGQTLALYDLPDNVKVEVGARLRCLFLPYN